ncbi:MAG: metal ABC transporter substrate-binding protein [Planctomycetota bacterium]|jgi:zinc transport system substrate-binding protein
MRCTVVIGLLLVACSDAPESLQARRGKPVVFTVNYPLQYFARRIAGDLIEVRFPAPAEGDPAFWNPDDATVSAYQASDLILLNGAGYAKWVAAVSLPRAKRVDTSSGIKERFLRIEDAVTHTHGPAGAHEHGDFAFTTWLDPTLAVEHARAIRDAFVGRWPADRVAFETGFTALERDLVALDASLAEIAPKEPLVASHPVYQYWARRYGANLKSVHFEPDAMPDANGWSELAEILRSHPARCMLWEGEPLPETAARLRGMGVRTVVFDPCGAAPEQGDFLTVMRRNVACLRQAFENPR